MARAWAKDEFFQKYVSDSYKQYLAESGNPAGESENLDIDAIAEKPLAMVPKAEAVVAPHARLLNQMLLSRAVDNFLLYLAKLLLLYWTKLGAVKHEDSAIEEFIGSLAEQYVEGCTGYRAHPAAGLSTHLW
jgi:hypothetical protein